MASPKLILLIGDNVKNLNTLVQILIRVPYKIELAQSEREGLSFIKERKPNLIILDSTIIDTDSFRLCKKLKANPETKAIPVIFISDLESIEERLKGFRVGGVDYISKPFHAEEVLARLKTHIELTDIKKKAEDRFQEQNNKLKERIKELKALYLTSKLVQGKENTLKYIFERLAKKLPMFWQYPELSAARITFLEEEFTSDNFKESTLKLTSDISPSGAKEGSIDIYCLDKELCEGAFLEEERELIDAIAGILGEAVERRKIEDKLKYRIGLEKLVTDLSRRFIDLGETNIRANLKDAIERIARFIDVDYSFIYLFSKDTGKVTDSFQWWEEGFKIEGTIAHKIEFSLRETPWVEERLKEGVVKIDDTHSLPEEAEGIKEILKEQSIRSSLILPLKYNDELIGAFGFNKVGEKKEWNSEEIILFEVVADIFVNVLERKRQDEKLSRYYVEVELKNMEVESLYNDLEGEFEKASKLHQQFLPKELPEVEGLSYSTYFQPSAKLGGDFYDVMRIEDQLVFYLADVSGHGLDGAMLNIFLREKVNSYLLYEHKRGKEIRPANLIDYVARKYHHEDFPDDYFICLLVGVIDLKDMRANFANAGFQFPPIIISNEGEVDSLKCGGLPIFSAFSKDILLDGSQSEYEEDQIYLDQGDYLFLTTDGLIEELAEDERYSEKRLKNILKENSLLTPNLITEKVMEDFKSFSDSPKSQDDITFFSLKRDLPIIDELKLTIASSVEEMHEAIAKLSEFVGPYYEEPSLICIGFQEILSNAVEHGNGMDQSKEVEIEIEVNQSYIEVRIKDQGKGFDWENRVEEEFDIMKDFADVEERGRGIKMTNKLYDGIWYNKVGNQAHLLKLRQDKKE